MRADNGYAGPFMFCVKMSMVRKLPPYDTIQDTYIVRAHSARDAGYQAAIKAESVGNDDPSGPIFHVDKILEVSPA